MNRREFLEVERGEAAPPPEALLRLSRRAMATRFEVLLPCGTSNGFAAAEAALDQVDRLEDQLSVYREHSEVSQLNRRAAHEPVPLEACLFDLLMLSQRLYEETDGAFDVSVGALIKAWGFFRRAGRVPSDEERAEVMQRVGMRHIVLNAADRTVRFARPGLEINLGSIGKGYALDRAVELLRHDWQITSALMNGGQSSIVALGSEPGRQTGWTVGLADPVHPRRRLAVLRLRHRALGTSAATFQHLQYQGRRLGHILDPRTGWPAEGLLGASALAPSGAEADALATAFFILGVDRTRAYCEAHADVGAVLIPPTRRPVVIGVPPADIEML